ncbi:unnamed protein product, partial [Schistosoma curassoni]|uniref:Endo/exonuclease/phosphatase domain-containing protein n=1 Tax=Schistosoma curassoni TaxID=6186 RepID=A0A183KYJ6_9TREM
MERPDNVTKWKDQSNSNENEKILLDYSRNQRIPLDPSLTAKVRYGRNAAVLRSQRENAPCIHGVALMLSKEARNALIGWESHGPRIIKASFKTKEGITMNIIQCYAPNNDNNDDDRDQFYETLQSIITKCSIKDLIILMGDLNANVSMMSNRYEDIMRRNGLIERKELEWLVIGGIIFPHKATCLSSDHTSGNQIDHTCISKKFTQTIEYVRTRREADIDSDHHLVVVKMKLMLKKHWKTGETALQRFNPVFLQHTNELNELNIA